MIKLIRFLKPHWKMALLAPAMMLIEVLMDLYQPVLMATIVDDGIPAGDTAYIVQTGLKMISVAAIGFLGGFGCTIASSIASQNFGADVRLSLFKKIQAFSFANLDFFRTSSLITRLTNDVTQVQQIVLMSLRMMVRAPLLAIGGIIMAVSINARLAAILLISIPILAVLMAIVIQKGFPLFKAVQKKLDRVNTVMRENLAGVRVVKAFVRSNMEKKRFGTANDDLMEITMKASRLVALSMPMIMLIMNLSVVAVLWFGGIQINQGTIQVGEVMAFINYMTQILMSLLSVAFIFMGLSRSKASGERIAEVLDTEIDIKNPVNAIECQATEGQVEFRDVTFHYPNSKGEPVLKNISFTAEPGQTIGLLGGTGSGKTTLVSLIPRLYDIDSGKILIDGQDIRTMDLYSLRSKIGFVLQDTVLFSGTIQENILWGNEQASEQEVIGVAKLAQAHEFINNFNEGYATHLGQRGVNVSGGQKQRISIARGLIKNPLILILDDSTSAVDLTTESRIQAGLRNNKNCTTFIIAQRISSIIAADKILVLEDAEIAAAGTHDQLIDSSSIYQDIYYSQMNREAAQ